MQKKSEVHLDIIYIYIPYAADFKAGIIFLGKLAKVLLRNFITTHWEHF